MIPAALSNPLPTRGLRIDSVRLAIGAALSVWLALVIWLAAAGAFVAAPGTVPWPIAAAVLGPVAAFFVGLAAWRGFRAHMLSLDLRWTSAVQAWRFAGFGFIALYAYAILPAMFAWPAGLGDIAIALGAPWMVSALAHRPAFARSKTFVTWNILGIIDLVVAVATGAISAATVAAAGEITARPLATLPLVLIPAFFVPIFLMLHVAALLQVRRLHDAA